MAHPSYYTTIYLKRRIRQLDCNIRLAAIRVLTVSNCQGQLAGSGGKIIIEAAVGEGGYQITSPINTALDPLSLEALQSIFWIEANEAAMIRPSREELEALGFDEPYAVVEASAGGESFILRLPDRIKAG